MKDLLDLVRGFVRPIVTLLMVTSAVIMLFAGVLIPEWFVTLIGTTIGFWFASRTPPNGGNGNST